MLARAVPFPVAVAPVVASSRVSVPNAVFVSLHTPRATSVRARLRSLLPGLGDRARLGACAGRSALRCTLPRVPVSQRRVARSASITMINTTLANDDSLFIGLDFGTSGARCVVIDADCNVVAETSAKYPPIADGGLAGDGIPVGGWAEAWQGALWELIDALPDHIRNKVKAIAVDGTSGTALVVDGASNECVYPPMLYNEKRDDAVAGICAIAPEGHTVRSASSALCKLHSWWFETDGGREFGKRGCVDSQKTENPKLAHHADWLASLLHGLSGVSDHNNALKLGFDPGLDAGDGENGPGGGFPDWILNQPYGDMIPTKVYEPGRKVGVVATEDALKRFPKSVVVVAGTTDSVAAFAAAMVRDPGDCVTSLGSSLALKMISETRIDDAASGVYSHRLAGKWLVGGASNLGGWLLRSHFSNKELVDLSLQLEDTLTREANEGNLASKETVTDYFPSVLMGFGLSVQDAASALAANRPTSDVAFLRNILHSIANVEARSYAKFVEMGASHEVTKVLTAGGGAQNEVWSGIRSTELGGVFVGKALHIEAAFGTALLARMGHYGLETYVPVIELRKED